MKTGSYYATLLLIVVVYLCCTGLIIQNRNKIRKAEKSLISLQERMETLEHEFSGWIDKNENYDLFSVTPAPDGTRVQLFKKEITDAVERQDEKIVNLEQLVGTILSQINSTNNINEDVHD